MNNPTGQVVCPVSELLSLEIKPQTQDDHYERAGHETGTHTQVNVPWLFHLPCRQSQPTTLSSPQSPANGIFFPRDLSQEFDIDLVEGCPVLECALELLKI